MTLGAMMIPAMASGASLAAIRAAAGDSGVWAIYSSVFTPGDPPAVASAANQWGTNGDIANASAPARPDASGSGPDAIFTFERASVQELFNDAISPVFIEHGNNVTMFLVAKPAAGANEYFLDLTSDPTTNLRGMSFQHLGTIGTFRVRTRTAARSLVSVTMDFTPDGLFHIFEGSIEAANLTVGIDGVITDSAGTTSGISLDQDAVALGGNAGTGTPTFEGPLKFACALRNDSAAQRLAVRQAIQAFFKTKALP